MRINEELVFIFYLIIVWVIYGEDSDNEYFKICVFGNVKMWYYKKNFIYKEIVRM